MSDIIKVENEVLEEADYYVKFKKPFTWEEKTYEGVDMSGLEELSGKDYCDISKEFSKAGNVTAIPQMEPEFACMVARKVTGIPIEFFYALPAKELNAIKNRVSRYFFSED